MEHARSRKFGPARCLVKGHEPNSRSAGRWRRRAPGERLERSLDLRARCGRGDARAEWCLGLEEGNCRLTSSSANVRRREAAPFNKLRPTFEGRANSLSKLVFDPASRAVLRTEKM